MCSPSWRPPSHRRSSPGTRSALSAHSRRRGVRPVCGRSCSTRPGHVTAESSCPPARPIRSPTTSPAGTATPRSRTCCCASSTSAPRQVAHARRETTWAEHLANVDTVARELGARRALTIDARELRDIHVPVLLLVGSRSPPAIKEATAALARGLPHARVVTLEGQGHSAMHSSPALFAATLLEFTAAIDRLSVQPEGASAASSPRASSSAAAGSAPARQRARRS